ncbi:hypothetical protein Pan44_40560 [Caulifigura coniformis]|uniref:Thioredoxin domain-containing protein n=1 Tax=Caulifigura coniformis TaxID=2527983 RepID=A0A517SIQ0_9PLAN|nr:peptidoglycan DD-metalloendopeptidase family protein [Caulifigura coniformis]QDT56007.1 hypothetical protein Pan44_40560 [Caulifigura coniformis]
MRTIQSRPTPRSVLRLLLTLCVVHASSASTAAVEPSKPKPDQKALASLGNYPVRYVVDYPAADRFSPPIATAFHDAVNTEFVHKGKRERAHPNGGYAVAMMERNGVSLLHTGADLGWFRVGAPVFAIADGVVRRSAPGLKQINAEFNLKMQVPAGPVDYGNLIIIEHRTAEDDYFLTLYGHLGDDRLVRAGDVVTAGQVIGTIGREAGNVNGRYKPHCHFAVHEGRWIEPGHRLMTLSVNGAESVVRLEEPGEKESRVSITPTVPNIRLVNESGQAIEFRRDGESYLMPSSPLWTMAGLSGARLAGYLPSVDGFRDPIRFLRDAGADTSPAPTLQCTTIHPLSLPQVVDQPAPELSVSEWLQPSENPPELTGLRGKVVCLVFFQTNCAGSVSHGLPALRELADKYASDDRVQVIGVHTPTRDFRRSAPTQARKLVQSARLTCPVAHLGDARQPDDVARFGVRATPWVVLVDARGTIDFSNWIIRPAGIVDRIDLLLRNAAEEQ